MSLRAQNSSEVTSLKCEYDDSPIGIDAQHPRFSWRLNSEVNGEKQTAYQILVSDDKKKLDADQGNFWDSGKQTTDQSIQISYEGKPLQATRYYYWKVKVWNKDGKPSDWSKIASWQMGLLDNSDWQNAQWIGYEKMQDSLLLVPAVHMNGPKRWNNGKNILPIFRKEFQTKKTIKQATIYISGLGHFELSINGKKVGDHFLDPGWTKYDKHALYVTFDITQHLKQGANAIGVMLGNGFYYIPSERYRKITGAFGYPKMICSVHVEYLDGTSDNIISNNSWKASPGPITFSSIYSGEDYDANLEQTGWDLPSFNDKSWSNAVVVGGPQELDAQIAEPLKILDRFAVIKITQPKPGIWVYDLGQNASAIPYIALKGKKGMKIKIIPAELLTKEGLVTQEAIGSPVYFNYTLKGQYTETWQPRFMYYGFRYLQIEGAIPQHEKNTLGLPEIIDVQSLHVRNAAETIGTFSCSNMLYNKIFSLIDWAIRSNTVSIFTDCPHREKLGWLEEAHLVGSSIRYTYDIASLSTKVVRDMINSQTNDGLIPDIAPEFVEFGGGFRDSPEWGSNGIIMPWYLYEWYGDKRILEESYDMMTRYADYLERKSKNKILSHGLGDWYDIGPKPPGESQLTPKGVTATAIYYYDLTILSKVASVLGKADDEKKYSIKAEEVKKAFNEKFFNKETKQYATGSQTANAIAVYVNLVEPEHKSAVIDNIVTDIRNRNNSLTAGDIGYRYLLRVLEDAGRSDVINNMNNRSDVPGYGYQLAAGATALTESWQGADNASNNHFMLGHLMEWFYSGLGGIRCAPNTVAFKQIIIRPEVADDISFAKATHLSPYGLISSEWKRDDKGFSLNVTIPNNTTATLYIPTEPAATISEGGKPVSENKNLKYLGNKEGRAIIESGSGTYSFQVSP